MSNGGSVSVSVKALYQHQRKRDKDGRLIVEPADYHMAYQICCQTFQESVGDMSEPERVVYEIIRKRSKSEFTEIFNESGSGSKDSLYKQIRSLKDKGYIKWVDEDDMNIDPKRQRSAKKYLKITGKLAENVNYYHNVSKIVDDPDWKEDGESFKEYNLKVDDDGMEILLESCRSEIAVKIIYEKRLDEFNELLATCGYKIVSNNFIMDDWDLEKLDSPQYSRKGEKREERPTFNGDEINEVNKFLKEDKDLYDHAKIDLQEQVDEDSDDLFSLPSAQKF